MQVQIKEEVKNEKDKEVFFALQDLDDVFNVSLNIKTISKLKTW